MVEIFFEQLNYETLKESEAYGVIDGLPLKIANISCISRWAVC